MDTPYGKPSDTITIGEFHGRKIAFLPRHGKKHTIPPHMINYKANIWAFKELGVKRIIAPSAVGSLKEEYAPATPPSFGETLALLAAIKLSAYFCAAEEDSRDR